MGPALHLFRICLRVLFDRLIDIGESARGERDRIKLARLRQRMLEFDEYIGGWEKDIERELHA